jgi:hypothetical protein
VISGLLIVATLGAQFGLDHVRERLAAGEYHSAWEALSGESDELLRSRMRAEILYRAGDPAGALRAARAGLAKNAAQIELLYYAAGASIWLEDDVEAVSYSARLVQAAEILKEQAPEEGRAWQEAAKNLASRSEALVARQDELSSAVTRLRSFSLGGIAFWLGALWFALRGQGRSSNPVS